jgi:N-acetylglucosaminyl-diphospho-decaprenol L-rhamnosyltransferase
VYGDGVGVVLHSPGAGLDRVLAALPAASTRPLQVVVVDGEGAGAVRIGEQVARAAAVNRGVVSLPPDVGWVLVTDPATEWPPGVLDTLLTTAERFPRAGALGPRLRGPDGALVACAGALPSRCQLRRGQVPLGAPRTAGPVGWISARALLLRRTAWDSVDGLDPRHLGPADSVDLSERLGRAGWLVVHVPAAEVGVAAGTAPGMLEPMRSGLRRYARDRR